MVVMLQEGMWGHIRAKVDTLKINTETQPLVEQSGEFSDLKNKRTCNILVFIGYLTKFV